jgi:hypothetical protein
MIISKSKKYYERPFATEEEIESIVLANSEYLFGSSSFLIPKSLIRTFDGNGTIPDAFAIDLAEKKWYIVEVELSRHHFWNHIVPQVTKQILAAKQPETRKIITDKAFELYKAQDEIKELFDELDIDTTEIYKYLQEIISSEPIIALPIDNVSNDMETWAKEQRSIVKIWVIKKYGEGSNPNDIMFEFPTNFRASIDTETAAEQEVGEWRTYDVSLEDLVNAGLMKPLDQLTLKYKPKNGEQKTYVAVLQPDFTLKIDDQIFNALSYAALYCINKSGSPRKTVNGWTSFRDSSGKLMSVLREEYLANGSA